MSESLGEAIAMLTEELPLSHVLAWAELLRQTDGPSDRLVARLIDAHPGSGVHATRFAAAWRQHGPALSGEAVALALEAAASVHASEASRRSSIVVSGPTSDAIPVRLTSSVVVEIIKSATESLLVVSFAAYGVDDISRELVAATERGVRVDLVFEHSVSEGGALQGASGAEAAFQLLRGKATFWTWPRSHRPAGGSLHAKLIAADRKAALLGSANLTGRALATNLEVGVILRDPLELPRCRCILGHDYGDRDEWDIVDRHTVAHVRGRGWSVKMIPADDLALSFAYTVGLWHTHRSPELAMFGLDIYLMQDLLNGLADGIAAGEPVEADQERNDLIKRYPVVLKQVDLRIIALGAKLYEDHRTAEGTGWVTLLGPEGNEFCIERSRAERSL